MEIFETWRVSLDMQLSLDVIVLRLLAAALLCLLIGWEREAKNKPAGMKTYMLVGIGSCALFLISVEFALGPLKDAEGLSPDPTRIFQGVVTGIGFLGAGAIIQGSGNVKGLTTGAGIWLAGAIGLACGGGYFIIAAAVTGMMLFILLVIGKLEKYLLDLPDKAKASSGSDKGSNSSD